MYKQESRDDNKPSRETSVVSFDSVAFTRDDIATAADRLLELGATQTGMAVRLVNAFSMATSHENPEYRRVLTAGGINYPDGTPVAKVLNRISVKQNLGSTSRVRGPSLFEETLRQSQGTSVRHFFFGASPGTLSRLRDAVGNRYPGAELAGFVSPPIAPAEELVDIAVKEHSVTGGDIIWLGLGTPKQDLVAHELATRLSRPCVGVGAAFDFLAGTQPVAPEWMQLSGFEWLYRFYCEPGRLWRRYTVGNIKFAKLAVPAYLRGN